MSSNEELLLNGQPKRYPVQLRGQDTQGVKGPKSIIKLIYHENKHLSGLMSIIFVFLLWGFPNDVFSQGLTVTATSNGSSVNDCARLIPDRKHIRRSSLPISVSMLILDYLKKLRLDLNLAGVPQRLIRRRIHW